MKKKEIWEERVKARLKDKQYLEGLARQGIRVTMTGDDTYPQRLMPYADKPPFLFYKGRLPKEEVPTVAMVGARACSNYGRGMAKTLAGELSRAGVQVVSGMARGIDTYSGLGALEGDTPSFAVLGCGVDICYPTENIELYQDLLSQGGILSEYPPGSKPEAWHFPRRNRIISGLADLVMVVEAKAGSGSLITVEWALEQGKDIMAVPGRIGDVVSSGCNRLIRSGAGIVTCVEDVLDALGYAPQGKNTKDDGKQKLLEKDLALLYSELSLQPKNMYELMRDTGLTYEELTKLLLRLQLMGLIEQPSENYYSRLNASAGQM